MSRRRDRLIRVWHGHAAASEFDGYEPERKPEAINAINTVTARNKKLLEERDPAGATSWNGGASPPTPPWPTSICCRPL